MNRKYNSNEIYNLNMCINQNVCLFCSPNFFRTPIGNCIFVYKFLLLLRFFLFSVFSKYTFRIDITLDFLWWLLFICVFSLTFWTCSPQIGGDSFTYFDKNGISCKGSSPNIQEVQENPCTISKGFRYCYENL